MTPNWVTTSHGLTASRAPVHGPSSRCPAVGQTTTQRQLCIFVPPDFSRPPQRKKTKKKKRKKTKNNFWLNCQKSQARATLAEDQIAISSLAVFRGLTFCGLTIAVMLCDPCRRSSIADYFLISVLRVNQW